MSRPRGASSCAFCRHVRVIPAHASTAGSLLPIAVSVKAIKLLMSIVSLQAVSMLQLRR